MNDPAIQIEDVPARGLSMRSGAQRRARPVSAEVDEISLRQAQADLQAAASRIEDLTIRLERSAAEVRRLREAHMAMRREHLALQAGHASLVKSAPFRLARLIWALRSAAGASGGGPHA